MLRKNVVAVVSVITIFLLLGIVFTQALAQGPGQLPDRGELWNIISELKSRVDVLEDGLIPQVNALEEQINTVTSRIDNLEEQISTLQTDVGNLWDDVHELNYHMYDWDGLVHELYLMTWDIEYALDELEPRVDVIEASINELYASKQDAIQRFSANSLSNEWSGPTNGWVDLPDMSCTINLERDSFLLVLFQCQTINNLGGMNSFTCMDETDMSLGSPMQTPITLSWSDSEDHHLHSHVIIPTLPSSMRWFAHYPSGTHTISIHWMVEYGEAWVGGRSLNIIAIPMET